MASPQVLRTTRRLPTETIGYEAFLAYDGQGLASYDTTVDFDAHVVEYDAGSGGIEYILKPDGSRIRVPLVLFVVGDAPIVPAEKGRLTLTDGRTFVVYENYPVHGIFHLRTEPDHYKIRCLAE